MSRALRRAGFLPRKSKVAADGAVPQKPHSRKTTVIVTLAALLLIVAAMLMIFVVFEGQFVFGIK